MLVKLVSFKDKKNSSRTPCKKDNITNKGKKIGLALDFSRATHKTELTGKRCF